MYIGIRQVIQHLPFGELYIKRKVIKLHRSIVENDVYARIGISDPDSRVPEDRIQILTRSAGEHTYPEIAGISTGNVLSRSSRGRGDADSRIILCKCQRFTKEETNY